MIYESAEKSEIIVIQLAKSLDVTNATITSEKNSYTSRVLINPNGKQLEILIAYIEENRVNLVIFQELPLLTIIGVIVIHKISEIIMRKEELILTR
ncbi:hypothetical protein [Priestia megaterium]|uniref:hypothetical protein n=1 Tax=Priestia megaterium TaxID=1404 RepID=UPI003A80D3A0